MYVIISNNKILYKNNDYDDVCDMAYAIEEIEKIPVTIKEIKRERNNKKYDDADFMS